MDELSADEQTLDPSPPGDTVAKPRQAVPVIHVRPDIREATEADVDVALELFETGSLAGDGAGPKDDPEDLRNLAATYIGTETAWLWMADLKGVGPVGMVALWERAEDVAELRRLRVHPDYRGRGIGKELVEHALRFCRERSYLKVVLDTFVERRAAIAMFEKFGFQFSSSRTVNGNERHDFFLDLYRESNGSS